MFGPEPKGGYTDEQKLEAVLQAAKKGGIEPLTKPNGKPTPLGKIAAEAGPHDFVPAQGPPTPSGEFTPAVPPGGVPPVLPAPEPADIRPFSL